MPKAQLDQRAMQRFPLQLPVTIKYPQAMGEANSQTRDVSARGICFYMDSRLDPGAAIEFTLTLPAEVTLTEAAKVRCKGKVVRVESPAASGKMAIAAKIEQYEFLTSHHQ